LTSSIAFWTFPSFCANSSCVFGSDSGFMPMGIKLRNEIAALIDAAHGLEPAVRGLRVLRMHSKVGHAYYGALQNQAVDLRRRLEKLAAELDQTSDAANTAPD
jgi:hypothetical protein